MSDAGLNPLEKVLRLCAGAAPGPWYPAVYSNATGANLDALGEALEKLWLDGLVRKAGGTPETGVGFVVSPAGERLLADPDALERLREGQPLWPDDPGSVIRHSLLHPTRPLVSRLLLFANFLVFAYGLSLASDLGIASDFLTGFTLQPGKLTEVLHRSGSVSGQDFLDGQWWRLLTMCFVHGGLLHLGMNMYAVYAVGAFAEQTWGRARFLCIYLLAGWGGSCLAVAYSPQHPIVGASGALCGILGAEAVWVLVASKYLPGRVRQRAWRAVVINGVLIAVISMLPRVSGWCHLGGALAGAAAAAVLHFQRFGPPPVRWLAPVALLPLPWLGLHLIDRARASNPAWNEVEEADFQRRFLAPQGPTSVGAILATASKTYRDNVPDLLDRHPTRRDPARVEKALQALDEQSERVRSLAGALGEAGPYRDERVEKARQTALDYARAEAELLDQTRRCLRAGERCALEGQQQKVEELRARWRDLLE